MKKFKTMKSILLTTSLTLGLSLSLASSAFAATYTTVSGDSLYKISQVFNTTITNLVSDNNLTTTNLDIGQDLLVPCKSYIVQKGDTLFLIARNYNTPLAALRRANNIYTDYIDIGQELNIPVSKPEASVATQSVTKAPATTPIVSETKATAPTVTEVAVVTPTVSEAPAATYSASDLDLLSRLIMAETQSESYDAKVAVGAVVMNRVKSEFFPSTISEVIYQTINGYVQFTPVSNGWINNPADSDSIKAAKEALSGVDSTNGALFYFDNTTTNTWLLSKPVSIKIDSMIYVY